MTTATLSTTATVGDDELELTVEYTYEGSPRELVVESCEHEGVVVWNLLTERQRQKIEDECVDDYWDRMEQDPRRVRGQRGY